MNFMRRRVWPGLLIVLCLLAGTIFPVPLPGMAGQAYASVGPDLTVQSIILSPLTPSIGVQTSFAVSIRNQGDTVADTSRLLFFIDDEIQGSAYISQIYAGNTIEYTFYWKAKAGAHIVKIVTDSEDSVFETDENNNEKSYAFSVLAPDLIVENLSWTPENPSSGEKVNYSITIKNTGNKLSTASTMAFFIDGTLCVNRETSALEAGESDILTFSLTASSGMHDIEVFADSINQIKESDETNNTKTARLISAVPDLVIQNFTWAPTTRTEGDNITASVTIKNTGSGNAAYSSLVLYIDDIYESSAFVEALNTGASVTKTFSCTVSPKAHILKAIIDTNAQVTESNESNNTMVITMPAIAADLIIQSITWSPSTPLISHMTHFYITVKNQGVRQSSECSLDFYISDFTKYHALISPLADGATTTVSFPWVPQSASISVKAVVDEENIITESNESNNSATAEIGFAKEAPNTDLSIQSFTTAPSIPMPGDDVTITTIVKNQGPGTAGPSHIACYVDDVLIGFIYVEELGSGATAEKSIIWPSESGEHLIKTVIDCNNSVSETNEANNERSTAIISTSPDLVIDNIEWFPMEPGLGKDVSLTLTIKNQGNRVSSVCYVTYYVDGSEQGVHYLDKMEPGASVTRIFSWNMQATSLTFKAVIDQANDVAESNETNNVKTLFLPAPNLTIDSISSSDDYPVANTTLTFSIFMINNGKSQAAGTRTDAFIDGVSISSIETGTINPGEISESVVSWIAVPGKHTLRVIADARDAITESDETDNVKEAIIFVPLPSSSINNQPETNEETAVTPPIISETGEPGETITPTVPDEIMNNLPETNQEESQPDISANLSATPDKASGGVKGLLTNKWLLIGVAVVGLGAIGALLVLRKRSGQPKGEKPAKPPKATKPPKPPKPEKAKKPAKQGKAPVKPGETLSGKPPVFVPPPPKPTASLGSKPAPIPIIPEVKPAPIPPVAPPKPTTPPPPAPLI
jgi:subtilase family serine protease